ncbi:MAG: DUF6465 family protein [Lachnospiraceae bacterium]|nr:DUF6465 family protein [Lachnospiraceae bacterium]
MATKKKPTREEFAANLKKEAAKAEQAVKKATEEVADKAAEVKKETAAKTAEVKKETETKAAEAKKETETKTKAAAQKAKATVAAAKKTVSKAADKAKTAAAAKKAEVKTTAIVQFQGRDFTVEDIIARAKDAYKSENKNKALKDIRVYIKPEDNAAYYVANDTYAGKIDL